MNSRDRVLTAIAHEEADRVPVDYWAVPEVTQTLLKEFGLVNEDELLEKLKIDMRYAKPSFNGSDFKEQPDGSLHKRLSDGTFADIWGVKRKKISWGRGRFYPGSFS